MASSIARPPSWSPARSGTEIRLADEEDEHAAAIAAYIVLLEAHARGLAGYWRTPEVLRTPEGRAAVSLPDGEKVLGLIHLGHPVRPQAPPERLPVADFATFLP